MCSQDKLKGLYKLKGLSMLTGRVATRVRSQPALRLLRRLQINDSAADRDVRCTIVFRSTSWVDPVCV